MHEVEIAASQAVVFDYLAELHDAEWRSGVREMRLLDDSPHRLGARHEEVRSLFGRRMVSTAEVVEYAPGERIAFRRATGRLRPQVSYAVTALAPDRSRVRVTMTVPVGPPLVRPLLTAVLDRTLPRELRKLAAAVGRTPTSGSA